MEEDQIHEPLLSNVINRSSRQSNYSDDDDDDNEYSEEVIRKKLQWFFNNPYQKYKERKRKPFKFIIQILKIILVTAQATLFAVDEFSVVNFHHDNIETFRQLFLLNYTGKPKTELYLKHQLYETMFYTWQQYYNYKDLIIGSYQARQYQIDGKKKQYPIRMCIENSVIFEDKDKVVVNHNSRKTPCHYLKSPDGNKTTLDEFIDKNKLPRKLETISKMRMNFEFKVNYTDTHRSNSPDCYQFNVSVSFDNSDLDGTMVVHLDSEIDFKRCRQTSGINIKERSWWNYYTFFDIIIIILCILSFALCCRSFKRHYYLYKDAKKFFCDYRHERFTRSDKLNFVNFWLVLISLSDICTVAGSVLKIILDWMEYPELYTACSLCFGLAVLFSWIGILRYLGFLKGYNILLVTMKTAFPSIVRFIICSSFIYVGFTICGWIVFGPYHEKFQSLYVTSECLFALVNGDDMYTTFYSIDQNESDVVIWYFSKIYLYIFISLFIYVILSLFIGIVADTYERIKDYGYAPKTRIELFMEGKEYHEGEQQHRHGSCMHT